MPILYEGGYREEAKQVVASRAEAACQKMSMFCPAQPLGWVSVLFIV